LTIDVIGESSLVKLGQVNLSVPIKTVFSLYWPSWVFVVKT